jgi:hypothetical protein
MTDIDYDAARALCDAATPGPWQIARYSHGGARIYREDGACRDLVADAYREGDREFLFAARDLVPALLDEVERLRGEHIGLGWFCRECRLWIKPWEQGDPPLSMTCPQCDNRAFTWTGAQVERDEARAEVERLQRIISEHSCSPRDALDMD